MPSNESVLADYVAQIIKEKINQVNQVNHVVKIITRDQNGEAGYTVACVKIGGFCEMMLVQSVEPTGPAANVGMSDHIGWKVRQIDDQDVMTPEHGSGLLAATRGPNRIFRLTLERIWPQGSDEERAVLKALSSA